MRTARHPIVLFIVAVLVVIGIGVGVVTVTQTSKIYGPPGARFTMVFPSRVGEKYMRGCTGYRCGLLLKCTLRGAASE